MAGLITYSQLVTAYEQPSNHNYCLYAQCTKLHLQVVLFPHVLCMINYNAHQLCSLCNWRVGMSTEFVSLAGCGMFMVVNGKSFEVHTMLHV